jgi:hypothetical protein
MRASRKDDMRGSVSDARDGRPAHAGGLKTRPYTVRVRGTGVFRRAAVWCASAPNPQAPAAANGLRKNRISEMTNT